MPTLNHLHEQKKPKLLVCDWDGTVVDSITQIIDCKQRLAFEYKLPTPSEDTIRTVSGMDFKKAMSICFPTAEGHIFEKLCKEFHHRMQNKTAHSKPFPHAISTLKRLKNAGMTLAIATSKSRSELDQALACNKVQDLFDITCCGEEYKSKPDPAMLQHIIQVTGVEPRATMMIGDSVIDILFAYNANVNAIGVTFGAHARDRLLGTTPAPLALIDNWLELLRIIKKLLS